MNELGVHAFDIGQHQQLLDAGVFAQVAFEFGIGVAPLSGRLAEEGDIQQIGLAGIDDGRLCRRDGGGDEAGLDGVGVDAVVEL